MWRELRYSFRQWRYNKAFTGVIILLLGAGVGANAVIFGFVNAILLRPLLVREPGNLFLIEKTRVNQVRPDDACKFGVYEQIRARTDLFTSAIASQEWTESSFQPLNNGDAVKMISTEIVSPNYFSDLEVRTMLGRPLKASDADATSDIPVVVSHEFWISQLNSDPSAPGRTLRIKGYPFRIVGVLPRSFHGIDIDRSADVRLPISATRILQGHPVYDVASGAPTEFHVFVRLKSGVSSAAAAGSVARTMQATDAALLNSYLTQARPTGNESGSVSQAQLSRLIRSKIEYRTELLPARKGISRLRDKFAVALYVLIGAAAILLFAICASVAGLLLARAERRRREIAIRVAIGASRRQLLRQIFSDVLLWTMPATGLALFFFYALSPILTRMLPRIRGYVPLYTTPQVIDVSMDWRVLVFLTLTGLAALLLCGAGAAWRTLRIDLNEDLKQNQESNARRFTSWFFVAAQVALCVILAASAAIMLRTFWNLEHLNPGFDRAHIIEIDLNPQAAGYSDPQTAEFFRDIELRVASLPGVRSTASAVNGVMHEVGMMSAVAPEGANLNEQAFVNTNVNIVSPGYFQTLGIPLLAGRVLDEHDRNVKPEPTVVNKAFADRFFPHQDAIGKALVGSVNSKSKPDMRIVGLVGTAKYRSLREENPPIAYWLENEHFSGKILYIRTFQDPRPLVAEIGKLIHDRDPRIPIVGMSTLEQEVQSSLWQERLLVLLTAFFGITALALAAAGIYGALSYSVTSRTREIGIRLAIGADAQDVMRAVCNRLSLAIITGLIFGLTLSAIFMRLAHQLFFGIEVMDLASLTIASLAILVLAAGASALPAIRAIKTDPATAMRAE